MNTRLDISDLNQYQVTIIENEFKKLSKSELAKSVKWYKDRIREIDNGTFNVTRYLNERIRFWFTEYRFVINKMNL